MHEAHVIEDLCFDVDFESDGEAFEQQARLAAFAQGAALRIIDEVFEQLDDAGSVLRFERVEIDLGAVSAQEMEAQWERRLRERLIEALALQRVVAPGGELVPAAPPFSRRTQEQARLEALLHFLRHGRLPWHSSRADVQALAWSVLEHDGASLSAFLRSEQGRGCVARRLVLQFSAEWIRRLAALGSPGDLVAARARDNGRLAGAWLRRTGTAPRRGRLVLSSRVTPTPFGLSLSTPRGSASQPFDKLRANGVGRLTIGSNTRRNVSERRANPTAFTSKSINHPPFGLSLSKPRWSPSRPFDKLTANGVGRLTVGSNTRRNVSERRANPTAFTSKSINHPPFGLSLSKPRWSPSRPFDKLRANGVGRLDLGSNTRRNVSSERTGPSSLTSTATPAWPRHPHAATWLRRQSHAHAASSNRLAAASRRPEMFDDPIDPDQPIFVANAGMVLAAPYLQRLLTTLGLLKDGAFVNPQAAERAVHLLQFMVTGATDPPEPQLVLNKLLCGLDLNTPVPRKLVPTPAERSAVEGMLQAMIDHWTIIGRTSIAGLRESFLQREGRLELRDDAWRLLVEPRPFDMLLDQLPWGYATLKYAWMERVIHVDWR
ncbi:contractile injection system tape measure protein [Piscinibacter sp.]|uniref:contractile injection system tape measure protein n=1 Tax=Piscinibacter sp. TaxID=1903157 RepID=UPI002CC46606|nr:contractile injection system tape measure protein [Albitalea sp.]HUG26161.1 contractile injection system tape measure protein [Albitalea sp.]